MAVGVGHQFVGLLAGGIEAHWVIHRLALIEGQIAVSAVHRTARGIDKVFSAVVAATFQQMAKAHQIALDVSRRILQGVTDPGLSRQVDHHCRLLGSKQRHQVIAVLQGHFHKAPSTLPGDRLDLTQPRLLERRVVVIVEIIEADNPISALQQADRQGCTDESGGTRYQDGACHDAPLPIRQRVKPAARISSGLTTERASNTQAGRRIRCARSRQFKAL